MSAEDRGGASAVASAEVAATVTCDDSHFYFGRRQSHSVTGAQVGGGSYGPYNAIVMAFSGTHLLGTYGVAATTTTDGLNNRRA